MEHEILTMEREIADLKAEQSKHTSDIKTLFNRQKELSDLVASVNTLALSVQELAIGQKNMNEDIGGLRTDVDNIKAKPGKRWESIVEKTLMLIVAAVVGWLLAKLGI